MSAHEKPENINRRSVLGFIGSLVGATSITSESFLLTSAFAQEQSLSFRILSTQERTEANKISQKVQSQEIAITDDIENIPPKTYADFSNRIDECFESWMEVGIFAKKLNNKNAGGIAFEGSAMDLALRKYEMSLMDMNKTSEEKEMAVLNMIKHLTENRISSYESWSKWKGYNKSVSDEQKQVLHMFSNKVIRGFINGFYGYNGLDK